MTFFLGNLCLLLAWSARHIYTVLVCHAARNLGMKKISKKVHFWSLTKSEPFLDSFVYLEAAACVTH